MADRITLNFGANTAEVESGTDRIAGGLDDVDRKLEDVGKAGQSATEDLASGADAAAQATDQLSDSADSAAGGLGSLGEVGKQVLAGDIGGAAESAAGLLEGLGPIAGAAGAVAAAGIGLVTAELDRQQARIDDLRNKFASMYTDAIQDGRDFISESQVLKEVLDIQWNTDRADEYKQAQADARALGIDLGTVLRAQAGDQSALNEVLKVSGDRYAEAHDKLLSFEGGTQGGSNPLLQQALETNTQLDGIVDRFTDIQNVQDEYNTKVTESKAIIAQSNTEQVRGIDAATERYKALAEAQATAANPPPIRLNVEVNDAGVDAAIARLQNRRVTVPLRFVDDYGRRIT